MTSPADLNIDAHLKGQDPNTGAWLGYQAVAILARTVFGGNDGRQPFQTNWGSGPVANSPASYDAITGTGLQVAGRHIDPYGLPAELHKLVLLLWYWLLDGCPTNMGALGSATNRIPLYVKLAMLERPWPTTNPDDSPFTGAMPGEPTKQYPQFPPATPTPLDSFEDNEVQAVFREPVHLVAPVKTVVADRRHVV